ncbi:hypothetical protein A2U01_0034631, partial [Trifolium medium]|nr:hypothetical protein [Trifolium medium]
MANYHCHIPPSIEQIHQGNTPGKQRTRTSAFEQKKSSQPISPSTYKHGSALLITFKFRNKKEPENAGESENTIVDFSAGSNDADGGWGRRNCEKRNSITIVEEL